MPKLLDNETRERLLDAADTLFSTRGFAAVTLRDVAKASSIHHTSIYYYMPGGKDQLYVEVMERNMRRHRAGMEQAIADAGADLREQLRAVARWLLSQPLMDFIRMSQSDVRAVDTPNAHALIGQVFSLHEPLIQALRQALERGEIGFRGVEMAAYSFVLLVEGLHAVPVEFRGSTLDSAIDEVVDLTLYGLKGA